MFPFKNVRGSMGGKSGSASGRSPQEEPDGLRARAYAKIVDLISEGKMAGFSHPKTGRILKDAVVSVKPSVTGGVLGNETELSGGSGYPEAFYLIIEGSGTGAKILCTADPITGIPRQNTTLVSGGTGYDYESLKLTAPSVIGQAVFLDDVQLAYVEQIPDDPYDAYQVRYSFTDVNIVANYGDAEQAPLKGFENAELVIPAEASPFTAGASPGPKLFTYTGDIDDVIFGVSVDSLRNQIISKSGLRIEGTSVTYSVWARYTENSGDDAAVVWYQDPSNPDATGWVLLYQDTISGKASSKYVRSRQVSLRDRGLRSETAQSHSWEFKVMRETPDSTSALLENSTNFEFAIGIRNTVFTYPYCALVGIDINAEQFRRIPVRAYNVKLLEIQVPTNYFPPGTVYAGGKKKGQTRKIAQYNRTLDGEEVYDSSGNPVEQIWDGSFYVTWSNNPAWCLYDLIQNERYGLGDYISKEYGGADKWLLYTIGKYCDASPDGIDDGFGNKEARFSCNTYLQARKDAYSVLHEFASIFRGMLYWSQGVIMATQDAPKVCRVHYSNSSVKDGMFVYSGTSRKVRHTFASVRWIDPRDNYRPKFEPVEDIKGIIRYGIQETEINAFACTSRGQARRLGLWALYSEREESDSVTFRTGFEALVHRPGDIFAVFDSNRASIINGGRVLHIRDDRKSIVLDKRFALTGTNHVACFLKPVGELGLTEITDSTQLEEIVKSRIVEYPVSFTSYSEEQNLTLNFAEPVDPEIIVGSVWGVKSSEIQPQYFRVMGVTEVEKHEFEVVGVEYNAGKFDAIEKGVEFDPLPISRDPRDVLTPRPPSDLQLEFEVRTVETQKFYRLNAHWSLPVVLDEFGNFVSYAYVTGYEVWIKQGLGNYSFYRRTTSNQLDIDIPGPDDYCVKVYSIGLNDMRSSPIVTCIAVEDETADLSDERITGLELTGKANSEFFVGPDANFDWRLNSAFNSYELGSEPRTVGANAGGNSPKFDSYEIKVYEPDNSEVVWTGKSSDSEYSFSFNMNKTTEGGPYRDFIFEVRARETTGKLSLPARIRVKNEAPAKIALVDVTIASTAGFVYITFPNFSASDVVARRLWMSESPIVLTDDSPTIPPSYEGNANPVILPVKDKITYYVRFAEYDTFSVDPNDCIVSDQASFVGNNPTRLTALDFLR